MSGLHITPVVDNAELEKSFERTEAVFAELYSQLKRNDLGEEFGKQMANAAKSAEESEAAIKNLFDAIAGQGKEAKSLLSEMRSSVEEVVESYEELGDAGAADESRELLSALDSLTDELDDNQQAVDGAVESYNELAASQKGVEKVSDDMADALKGAYDLILGKTQNLEGTIKKVFTAYSGFQKLMQGSGVDIAAATTKMTLLQKAFLSLGKALVRAGLSANAARLALSAMSAVPVVAAITAIILVLRKLVKHHQEVKQAAEEARMAQEEFYSEVSKGAAPSVAMFEELSRTWQSLSTDMEKTEFLKASKKAFDELGISVNTLEEAQRVLVDNADTYIQAQMKMAQADVYRARARSQTEELINLQQKLEDAPEGKKRWTEVEETYIDDMGNELTEKVRRKISEKEALQKEIEAKQREITESQRQVLELSKEGAGLLKEAGAVNPAPEPVTPAKTPKTSKKEKAETLTEEELREYTQERLNAIVRKIEKKVPGIYQAFEDMMASDSVIKRYINEPIDTEEVDEAYNELIDKFGSYEEKRLAIHMRYLGLINASDGRERELYQAAMDEELLELERSLGPTAELQRRAEEVSEIFMEMGDILEDIGGTIGEIGSGIGALGKAAKEVVDVYAADQNGEKFDKFSSVTTLISSVVNLAGMVGEQIKENKEAQKEWNRTIEQSVHELTMLNLEALDYKQRNIFGVENPYKKAIDGARQYSEAMKALQEQTAKLNGGKVQTGTKKALNWANVGKGAAIGASAGAVAGAGIFTGVGAALGAAIGAAGGLVAGLFSTKVVPVFESLTSKYGTIVNEDFSLNKNLLADYDKLDEDTKRLVDNWEEIRDKAKEAEEQMRETFSSLAGNIGSDLSDSLVNAFRNGKLDSAIDDFHDKMNSTIEDIVEQMIFSNIFSEMFDELQKDMEASFKAGGDNNIVDDLMRFENAYQGGLEEYQRQMDEARAYLKSSGYDKAFDSNESREASSRSSLGASQDSIDESNGRLTAIQAQVFQMNETVTSFKVNYERLIANTAAQLEHTQGIHVDTTELKKIQADIREPASSIRRDVSAIVDKGVKMK